VSEFCKVQPSLGDCRSSGKRKNYVILLGRYYRPDFAKFVADFCEVRASCGLMSATTAILTYSSM
jgi:hypothetical protein